MGQEIELNSNIRKSLAVPPTTDMKSSFVFIDDRLLLSAWIDAMLTVKLLEHIRLYVQS